MILGVLGIDAHSRITHNRFGTSGGYHCVATTVLIRVNDFTFLCGSVNALIVGKIVAQIVQFAVFLFEEHLIVADSGEIRRIPIHHTQTAINQALVVQVTEHFHNRLAALFIHRERRAIPIA